LETDEWIVRLEEARWFWRGFGSEGSFRLTEGERRC
jgi:hypothetical protein